MPLLLDEQQNMLRDSVHEFLAAEAPVSHLRALRDQRDPLGFSPSLWRKFGYMGFAGALVPADHGGMELGHVEAGVIMEEIGRHLTPSPFWATSVVAATALRRAGSVAQQAVYLPGIGAGEMLAALALEEHGKHDPMGVRLEATPTRGNFLLDGVKTFVVDGHIAQVLLVVARTGEVAFGKDGLTVFLVDPKSPGLIIERTSMVDSHNAARLRFDGVVVTPDSALGGVGQGWQVLAPVLDAGRAALAAELVGIADEVLGRTVGYLKQRVQFGRRLGEFQALQHRAAQLHAEIEVARAAVLKAAQALDAGSERAELLVAVAKAKAGGVATMAVQEAVQMHGGMGVTDELDIGLFMKRARVLGELFGDHRFHARRVADINGY